MTEIMLKIKVNCIKIWNKPFTQFFKNYLMNSDMTTLYHSYFHLSEGPVYTITDIASRAVLQNLTFLFPTFFWN